MSVPDLQATDFAEFFTSLWSHPPFAWQRALAERVLGGDTAGSPWPETIALPTASGKTACMDVVVFALAAQAPRMAAGQTITAPRRVFFVVDRRVIVDEAYERAKKLAQKLEGAEEGILKRVADNLRQIARGETTTFDDEHPLAVHALRGGMYRSEAWARNPLQPTIVASTVDQIGSRLLFRAYGRGSGTWPIYAGLVANDSLILLDEAHCAGPFLQTLGAVRRFQAWAQEPLQRCFHPVVMSATPPADIEDRFEDTSQEPLDPDHPLGRRQLASKPAMLRPVKNATGRRATSVTAKVLVQAVQDLVDEERRAIVVFVNRVATARETHRLLADDYDDRAVLLTGRMRPVDKDAVVRRLKDMQLQSDCSEGRVLTDPIIVVATQTLEVGADLDFDGLVTECASLDALRQRFGRLNRMGRAIKAQAVILGPADQNGNAADRPEKKKPKQKDDDPVYGPALAATWKWLNERKNEKGEVDFGIVSLDRQLPKGESLNKLNAPSPDAPVMLPAHVDCWAQTAPQPSPSPDVALFLHGPREGVADVQVCWRADLDLTNEETREYALESLSLCPPSSSETLPVPIYVFKRWLAGKDMEDGGADVEGIQTATDADEIDSSLVAHPVIRWRGIETNLEKDVTTKPADIRPGDVIVIPAARLGLQNPLGDLPPDSDLDIGDRAYRLARAKAILRLHPKLVDAWPEDVAAKATARELLKDLGQKYEDDPDEVADAVRDLLRELSKPSEPLPERWSWLSQAASELKEEFPRSRLHHEVRIIGGESLILVGRRRIRKLTQEADHFSDEDDAAASGISHKNGCPVRLCTHLPGVEAFARRHARGCGLPEDLIKAVTSAGLLHDLGKADPRFQALLQGGAPWGGGELLAKSARMPRTPAAQTHARAVSGYPRGGRHELLSVRLAESAPALLPERDDLRDLTLHLVASHHGHCRPFAPVVVDKEPVSVEYTLRGHRMHSTGPTGLERLDSGVADRYWRLVRRYGWWGLAWLEALLRLADWRRSEWEEAHEDEDDE